MVEELKDPCQPAAVDQVVAVERKVTGDVNGYCGLIGKSRGAEVDPVHGTTLYATRRLDTGADQRSAPHVVPAALSGSCRRGRGLISAFPIIARGSRCIPVADAGTRSCGHPGARTTGSSRPDALPRCRVVLVRLDGLIRDLCPAVGGGGVLALLSAATGRAVAPVGERGVW